MSTTRRRDSSDSVRSHARHAEHDLGDRRPPFDMDAEIGVLGSIFLKPDTCDDLALLLRPDDFYDDAHRKLFEHMLEMHEQGKKIDITLLVDRLRAAGDYELIRGSPLSGEDCPCRTQRGSCRLLRGNRPRKSNVSSDDRRRHGHFARCLRSSRRRPNICWDRPNSVSFRFSTRGIPITSPRFATCSTMPWIALTLGSKENMFPGEWRHFLPNSTR
jgi:hypothetical protein